MANVTIQKIIFHLNSNFLWKNDNSRILELDIVWADNELFTKTTR